MATDLELRQAIADALLTRIADMEDERNTYRELLQRNLDLLSAKTVECQAQHDTITLQRQTIRELREVISHISAERGAA